MCRCLATLLIEHHGNGRHYYSVALLGGPVVDLLFLAILLLVWCVVVALSVGSRTQHLQRCYGCSFHAQEIVHTGHGMLGYYCFCFFFLLERKVPAQSKLKE